MNNILEYQCKSAFEKIQHKENIKVLILYNEIDLYRDVLIDLDVEAKNISSISVSNFDFFIDESLLDNSFDLIIGNPPNTRQEKIKDLKPIVSEYQSFYNTADLNVYYFERAFYLLKKYAIVSFLTPSKYTKAKYAKRCREFLLGNMNIVEYIDFVETSIILLQKSKELNSSFDYCRVEKQDIALKEYISKHQYNYLQNDLDRDMFVFLSSKVLDIKIKIEKNPLEYINENSSKYITALKNSKVLTFYKESIKYKNN